MSGKLCQDEITSDDINDYLDESSDFVFELETLKLLSNLGFRTSHGGTYVDPIEGKIREYDIRARKDLPGYSIFLAVECKNIRPFHPLLLQRTPCTYEETKMDCFLNRPQKEPILPEYSQIPTTGEFVGRSATQVGRLDNQSKTFKCSDSEVYSKWTQAINSCFDSFKNSFNECYLSSNKLFIFLPILVVPDGHLWVADFDLKSLQREEPKRTDYSCLYLGQNLNFKPNENEQKYIYKELNFTINHIHVCTMQGISDFIEKNIYERAFNLCNKYSCS
jgi:hypothetical protein